MAKHTVTEFGIEVQFSEKVMTGLTKLEQKVMAASVKMEQSLNKVFRADQTRPLQESINKLGQNSNRVFENMGRNLRAALDVRLNTRNMFGSVVSDAERAARQASRALSRINAGAGAGNRRNPPTGGNGGNAGGGGRPPRAGGLSEQQRLMQRFNSSAMMQRIEMSGGSGTVLARQMQSRAALASIRMADNTQNFRRELARLTMQMREHEAAVRRDTAATRAEERARLNAQRAEQRAQNRANTRRNPLTGGGGGSAKSTMLGMLGANAVTMAIGTAVRVAKEAYAAGTERSQAKTMMSSAFGQYQKGATESIQALANKYGLDTTETMKQFAILRNTMPKESFTNKDLLAHMENLNVFSHATGVNQEAQGRANYAISQISGSAKINKQDINQLTNAIPEALNITAKAMGISKTKLIASLKDIKPEVFLKNFEKGMKDFNDSTGAAVKAQTSIQASQGRLANAWQNDLVALFDGTGASIGGWMDRMTKGLIALTPVFKAVGENIKSVSDACVTGSQKLAELKQSFDDWYKSLSPESKKALDVLKTGMIDFLKWMGQAFIDVFQGLFDSVKKMFAWFSGKDSTEADDGVKRSKTYGNGVEAGSPLESFLNFLDKRHTAIQRDENTVSPMLENLKATAMQTGQNSNTFSGDYGLKQKATDYGRQFDLGSKKYDFGLKATPLNGEISVTVNFDEGSLNRAIAKVSGQVQGENDESQRINVNPMGGGWQSQADNVGWQNNGNFAF